MFPHRIVNFDAKLEKMTTWQNMSIREKLKIIDKKLDAIYDKRQVILRDFSKRFSEEHF